MDKPWRSLRPLPEVASRYREAGWWRDETFVDDLRRAATSCPDGVFAVTWRRAHGRAVKITFAELARHVDRFASTLQNLGVRHGDPVAFQLPNWWETSALTFACFRVGAVAVPIMMTIRARELEQILGSTRAKVCLVPDVWEGFEHARALAEMAPRLLSLEHRVVAGDSAATAALDFTAHFMNTAGNPRSSVNDSGGIGPDEVALITSTSGTTGEPRGVMHTPNTLYAGALNAAASNKSLSEDGQRVIVATPHAITNVVGLLGTMTTMVAESTCVYSDKWDADLWLDLLEESQASHFHAVPSFVQQLVSAQQRRPRGLAKLRAVRAAATAIPPSLVSEVKSVLGASFGSAWGMTETGMATATRLGDPEDWAVHSDGAPLAGIDLRLDPADDASSGIFRLHVRGAPVCVGVFERDSDQLLWTPAQTDGWYDTGDFVRADGRGGIKWVGRVAERIRGKAAPMIPVADVEAEILTHPAVREVALVGYADPEQGELPCAFLVPEGTPPTLKELRDHLARRGMTDWYLPTRVEYVDALPRNHFGKVLKVRLRDSLKTKSRE